MFAILVKICHQDDVSEHFHLEAGAEQAGQCGSLVIENRLKWQQAMD